MATAQRIPRPARRPRPVVGLGLCVLDRVYAVEDLALGAARTRYHAQWTGPGGMVTNALVQAAALGCRATLLSAVGADADGRALLRALRERGVSTRDLVRSERTPTTHAVVLVDRRSGERRFVVPDRRAIERASPRFALRALRRGAVLLIDGHHAREARAAVQRAGELGVSVVADFADARPAYRRLLPGVDHAIVPQEFVAHFGAGDVRETLRALARVCRAEPVVTLGARGALALVGGRFRRIGPHRTAVRDTTGAGDAFHGAFAAGLAHGLPLLEALELASRAGAAACAQLGATAHLSAPASPPASGPPPRSASARRRSRPGA